MTSVTTPKIRLANVAIQVVQSDLVVFQWEIPRSTIKLARKLGAGQFGDVWEGVWNGTTPVAVKTLKADASRSVDDFLKEAAIMKKLRHSHIVLVFFNTSHCCVIFKLVCC